MTRVDFPYSHSFILELIALAYVTFLVLNPYATSVNIRYAYVYASAYAHVAVKTRHILQCKSASLFVHIYEFTHSVSSVFLNKEFTNRSSSIFLNNKFTLGEMKLHYLH